MSKNMNTVVPTRYWHRLADGRIQCDLCPRECKLHAGQQGLCFVRANENNQIVLTSYGRSTGFVIDPVEKKPLNHFKPGSSVLSFGTAGCNLACKYCQNWDMSKARDLDRMMNTASPKDLVSTTSRLGVQSIAYTYNDPIVFMEYAMDTAKEGRSAGISSIAVTAGYIHADPREEFFEYMDAVNIDLKSFDEKYYYKLCGGHLKPVLETIDYVANHTNCWLELTTLLIPGYNDSIEEVEKMSGWILDHLGPDVPLHFTAFHPDYKMRDVPFTTLDKLLEARNAAMTLGLHYVYTGNVRDEESGSTYCPQCGQRVIGRIGYLIHEWNIKNSTCQFCGSPIAGVFEDHPGQWGGKRESVCIGRDG